MAEPSRPSMTARSFPRVTKQLLHATIATLPPELRANGMTQSVHLAFATLHHFFGLEWLERYVRPDTARPNSLRIEEGDGHRLDLSTLRVIDLAEVLINLQDVPGFSECIEKMRKGDIDGTFGELDLGRMLFLNQVPFEFVVAQGAKTLDYDVEVTFPDGVVACAEAKCNVESTNLGKNTILNKLKKASKQLPPDRPGIIFVKMPPGWMDQKDFTEMTLGVAREFLKRPSRVVSVKFYVSPNQVVNGFIKQEHAYKEISNPEVTGRDWRLFRQWDLPPEANGMPPHWQRILFFPDGKPW